MKKIICFTAALSLAFSPLFSREASNVEELADGFRNPPDDARPLTWWHWINGNVTKDGIRADLEDMKRVGIGGVQMLDVSIYLPEGPVRYGSKQWYDHVAYAVKTAAELGLEFDLMNCPGWSASGGPWVAPETSMKMLTFSEVRVGGGKSLRVKLPRPIYAGKSESKLFAEYAKRGVNIKDFYRDIAVIAVPADPKEIAPSAVSSDADEAAVKLLGGVLKCAGKIDKTQNPSFTVEYPEAVFKRGVEVFLGGDNVRGAFDGTVSVSDDGENFKKIGGYSWRGGIEKSKSFNAVFPRTKAKFFRLTLAAKKGRSPWPLNISAVEFSDKNRIANWRTKIVGAQLAGALDDVPDVSTGASDADAIRPSDIIDLTSKMTAEGTLEWNAPAGEWNIIRLGYCSTGATNHPAQPEGWGLEIDKFDPAAAELHFNHAVVPVIDAAKAVGGSSALKGILTDSWEAGQQNWTANFPALFKKYRGYDIGKYIAALTGRVLESRAKTEAFYSDFRRTVADAVAFNYYGKLRELGNAHNLKLYSENYGGVLFNEQQAASQVDVIMGEFWVSGMGNDVSRIKKVSSSSHVAGKKITGAESFTAKPEEGRWTNTPASIKTVGDLVYTRGLNKYIFHTYAHQPLNELKPGFTLGRYGTHFGRTNTWWPEADAWLKYVARCQYMLSQGTFKADALAMYSGEINFFVYDSLPKLPAGYDFDMIEPFILEEALTDSANAEIVLKSGGRYKLLCTPPVWRADLKTLEKILEIRRAGIPIIGSAPLAPRSLTELDSKEWKNLRAQIWPNPSAAASEFPKESEFRKAFETAGIQPDCVLENGRNPVRSLRYIHRTLGDADFYFIANIDPDKSLSGTLKFRVAGKRPQIWNPVDDNLEDVKVYTSDGKRTYIDTDIPAKGSMFVVFAGKPEEGGIAKISAERPLAFGGGNYIVKNGFIFTDRPEVTLSMKNGKSVKIEVGKSSLAEVSPKTWNVEFISPFGKTFVREFDSLSPWNESDDDDVKYFSGRARYTASFETPKLADSRYILELGKVRDIARVYVNGKDVGTAWVEPYSLDITDSLKGGKNTVEIIAANTWVNALIGDERFPLDADYNTKGSKFTAGGLLKFPDWYGDPKKYAQRKRSTFATWRFYDKDSPLTESGLIGPVVIREFKKLSY